MKERVAGLKALLHSNRVLSAALRDIKGPELAKDRVAFDFEIGELKKALNLELRGTDFLEFSLKGNQAEGLGTDLQAITTRFLESLLMPEQETLSASQVLLEKRRKELQQALTNYERFRKSIGRDWRQELARQKQQLAALQQGFEDESRKVEAASTLVAALKEKQALPASDDDTLEVTIRRAKTDLVRTQGGKAASTEQLLEARNQLDQLNQLQAALTRLKGARTKLAALETSITSNRNKLAELQSIELQALQFQQRIKEAEVTLDGFMRRYATVGTKGLQVLEAPQSIKMIDQPRDPLTPEGTGLKFALGILVAGLLLGAGLALAAEVIDQRIRRPEQVEAITGLPVVARLSGPPD
ncbi:MAG: hypothetical protein RLZ98_2172 [Pseudomonadota bacterium]|jgi:uncharacterized protein involved in exopolysaccharide biosynthesis